VGPVLELGPAGNLVFANLAQPGGCITLEADISITTCCGLAVGNRSFRGCLPDIFWCSFCFNGTAQGGDVRATRDVRAPVFVLTALAIGLFGYLVAQPWLKDDLGTEKHELDQTVAGEDKLPVGAGQSRIVQADPDFAAGIAQLQAGNAREALVLFRRFSARAPLVPEAQVGLHLP